MNSCIRFLLFLVVASRAFGADLPIVEVEGQPLGANVLRLARALDFLGAPLPREELSRLEAAAEARDSEAIQKLLDPRALAAVSINPEVRVKARRGPAKAVLRQGGFSPFVVKVLNDSTAARPLRVNSPQAGPVYSGSSLGILKRQAQTHLKDNENVKGEKGRFLSVETFGNSPMSPNLSGLEVEYVLVLIYSHEAGRREATLQFDLGQGTQDLGFRAEVPILFEVLPAKAVELKVLDFDGTPTTARFEFRDFTGRVYPPQAKRLAPDFFFQPQVYRASGQSVLLPPGKFTMETSRGPEYRVRKRQIEVPAKGDHRIEVRLERWVDPARYGFYSGDHHIHGAGCSHYDSPTQGVTPADMFLQVKGEGLNVGCVLTWGPCFDFQRNYFSPNADKVSEPLTLLKYDLEISGFGSAPLGHVCLLNLKDQTYPKSKGTKTEGWPSWTIPVMRWCKEQGGVTGYPHSALTVNPPAAAKWLLSRLDADKDGTLSRAETADGVLPGKFEKLDVDGNKALSEKELSEGADRAADELPNLAIPALDGPGGMEVFVSTVEGVCDFISAMDTPRVSELNTWYHVMNCGFPLKLSGETDFPCMSSRRVGAGRVYVQLGSRKKLDFAEWCRGLGAGRSYVSDGYSHALRFEVGGKVPGGEDLLLDKPGKVGIKTKVSFAPETPMTVAQGLLKPAAGRRLMGDTVNLHAPRQRKLVKGGRRLVELVVNGQVVAKKMVPADGKAHDIEFEYHVARSSWVALRQFPQLHTNPVNVLVGRKPIRASRQSALWCAESVELLWHNRHRFIKKGEQAAARLAYDRAFETYRRIAGESP